MPVHISTANGLRTVVFSGAVTPADVTAIVTAFVELDTASVVTPHRLIIFDDDVVVDFRHPDVERMATRQASLPIRNPIRTAIVVTSQITVGYARMYQLMARHPLVELRDFPSVPDAMQWLQSD